ncbi:winged helix-turn-helix transcriptional regulator [Candidatus Roizmanbacteria bacterium]|nr:winged helix-turn-helix transcriptional regulator [Candidatus Roizmanbacteria bacterium]
MLNRSYILGHEGHPHYLSKSKLDFLKRVVSLAEEEGELLIIIKALSDGTKYKIYRLLQRVEEIPVSDIAHILSLSQSSVSHALSALKLLGLIEAHKCGKLICYSLKKTKIISRLKKFLHSLKISD